MFLVTIREEFAIESHVIVAPYAHTGLIAVVVDGNIHIDS